MATWTLGFNATGPRGPGLVGGSSAPASSDGAVNDYYLYTGQSDGPYLYGPKTSSGWPTTYTALKGAAGAAGPAFKFGTTQPGPPDFAGLSIGDFFLRTDTGNLLQYQRVSGSVTMVQIGNFIGPQGSAGLSVLSGSGAPASSLGAQSQVYIDVAAGNLYVKSSSGWTLSINLVGSQGLTGASIQTGTGAPSSSVGNVGDIYVDLTANAVTLYGKKTGSGWPSSGTSLQGAIGQTGQTGATGSPGLSVLSGSGAPASSLGVQNQPAYLDTSGGILYGAKGASAWPSTGLSLNGLSVRNGSGAPTSTKPTVQFDGDFYVDTAANVIYGPRASGSWPSSGVAFAGNVIRTGSGAPDSSLGATGDLYIDGSSGLLYSKASGSWVATGGNLKGPQGAQGPAVLGNTTVSGGPCVWWNAAATSTAQNMYYTGSSIVGSFVPSTASAFMGATLYNGGSAAATVTLYDLTASKSVYSVSVAAGTLTNAGNITSTTTYPMVSGNTHVWQITGASGSTPVNIAPYYLMPANTSSPCVTIPGLAGNVTAQTWGTSATASANFIPFLGAPFTAANSYYIYPARSGYLYGVTATYIPSGSTATTATMTLTFGSYNKSGGAQSSLVQWTLTANSTPTYFGPFTATQYPTTASIQYYFAASASSGSGQVIVTPQYVA